jgi:hypothetical protein
MRPSYEDNNGSIVWKALTKSRGRFLQLLW